MPAMRTGWLLESRIRLPDVCQKPVPAAWAWDWRRAWPRPRPSRTTIRTAAARRSSAERAEPLTMNVGSTVFPRHEISGMLESALTPVIGQPGFDVKWRTARVAPQAWERSHI